LNTVKNLEPIINSVISRINFRILFAIDNKNNLDFILYKDNEEFQYKDLSSGQRLILTIAFQVALLLEKGDVGFIVADEGFSVLDDEAIKLLYELFETLPFQLISIIHRVDNIGENVNVIRLDK
jgi:energy-coupling factor transporter ATP-binding protein EcfA2